MSNITINSLPAQTWNRLDINSAVVDTAEFTPYCDGGSTDNDIDIKTGMGEEFNSELSSVPVFKIENSGKAVVNDYIFTDNTGNARRDSISLSKGESMIYVQKFNTELSLGAFAVQTKISLDDNASFTLVQIQKMGANTFYNDIGAELGKESQFRLIQIILSDDSTYTGVRVTQNGDNSDFDSTVAYKAGGDGKFDINYIVDQYGKNTNCNIISNGVLYGNVVKTFRGTIDFKEGASGSKGAENEDVLLMDDTVRNKTIPIILCHEEDVEGTHGATIGKIDEEELFYIQSRGIGEKAVYALLADARIAAAASKIPDAETRDAFLASL